MNRLHVWYDIDYESENINTECMNNFTLNTFVSGLGTSVPHLHAIAADDVHDSLLHDVAVGVVSGGQLDGGVAASIFFT